MKVKARSKWIKISPRKLGLVTKVVRGKLVVEALRLLQFLPNKGARILEKVIKSAVANAKNNFKLDEDGLIVSEAFANKAITMRRWQPRARGRIFPINKRTSHVTICVAPKQETVSKEES